jgi:hypothetical protein
MSSDLWNSMTQPQQTNEIGSTKHSKQNLSIQIYCLKSVDCIGLKKSCRDFVVALLTIGIFCPAVSNKVSVIPPILPLQ